MKRNLIMKIGHLKYNYCLSCYLLILLIQFNPIFDCQKWKLWSNRIVDEWTATARSSCNNWSRLVLTSHVTILYNIVQFIVHVNPTSAILYIDCEWTIFGKNTERFYARIIIEWMERRKINKHPCTLSVESITYIRQ